MGLGNGIRKHGFRNWHERLLLVGHGWLVVALIASIAAFASLETLITSSHWIDRLANLAAFTILAAITVVTLRRFIAMLVRAQRAATQARCPQCETYGRLTVVAEDHNESWVRVRCRQCGHEWPMDDG